MDQTAFIKKLFTANANYPGPIPDKELAEDFIDRLFDFLFLPKINRYRQPEDLEKEWEQLKTRFAELVEAVVPSGENVETVTAVFFKELPLLYERMVKDAEAILSFDPAAGSVEEVLLAYPGFYATAVYRISHQLWNQNIKILPRIFTEHAHGKTGIDIHPGASIGDSFFIDHGTGIVIGETAVIKDNVKLYQGVTLGALNVKKDNTSKRHPTIESNVTIYSGATILGGDTVVGHDSIIGGNTWLTYSVQAHSVVYHKSEVKVRDNNPFPEPLNFMI
jgi:serine O-acetyltransferase